MLRRTSFVGPLRVRGRVRRGQRCRAPIPHGHWKTTTFTGALRLSGMTAPMVLDGPMNADACRAYIVSGAATPRSRLLLNCEDRRYAAACRAGDMAGFQFHGRS